MINDLKMGFKVLKYGLSLKSTIIVMVLFWLLGCVMDIFAPMMSLGGLYTGLGAVMLAQLIHSVAVSTMVQTSPYKKRLQTIVPGIIGGGFLIIANTISICLKLLGMHILEWEPAEISNAILFSGGLMTIMAIYMGAALKLYWPSTIIFIIVFMIYYGFATFFSNDIGGRELIMILPMELSILVNYVTVIAGCITMYLIFLGAYKLDYSKMTWEAALKRAK